MLDGNELQDRRRALHRGRSALLCDFCSQSVGSFCRHCLEGVPADGLCDYFDPTLQSVFGLRWLARELRQGVAHVGGELCFLAETYRLHPESRAKMLQLTLDVPRPDHCPAPYPPGRPVLRFASGADKARAVLHLRAAGMRGLEGQPGLFLEFTDAETLGHAVTSLVEAGAVDFRITSMVREELVDAEFGCPFCGERKSHSLFAGSRSGQIRCGSCGREYPLLRESGEEDDA